MRILVVAAGILLSLPAKAVGQDLEEGDVYVRSGSAEATVLRGYETATRTCSGAPTYVVGRYARVILRKAVKLDSGADKVDGWIAELTRNDTDLAPIGSFYCVAVSDIDLTFRADRGPETGILAVPFKIRFDPVNVMAGSTLGGYLGKGFGSRDSRKTLLGFAGLTNVPLNDTNAEVPQTKWGVSAGAGGVWTIRQTFQVGLVSGVDFFNGVEDWAYGYNPWLSLSIGFTFTSTEKAPGTLTLPP